MHAALLLGLANLMMIGLLPRIFFRRGRLTAGWWWTALPFLGAAAALLAAAAGFARPWTGALAGPREVAAVAAHAGSLLWIGYTLGTHQRPLSLWHQRDDRPEHLVTWGAYARVRHPFYLGFLVALVGCALAFPHPVTVAALVYAAVRLERTAAREERAFLESPLASEYRRYRQRTGRLLPALRRAAVRRRAGWRSGRGRPARRVNPRRAS
jgi:protein-S-isoprenylcysteine O-methyltransferase Ste14